MKKIVMLFAAACVVGSAFAQMSFGIKGGLNISKYRAEEGSISMTTDERKSFHGGVFFVAKFSDNIAIQPEAVLSMEGGEFKIGNVKAIDKFTYINIPILLRMSVLERFHIYAGPQIGLKVAAETEIAGKTTDMDGLKTLNLGLGLGAGLYITEGIEIYGRYNLGLSNVNDLKNDKTIVKTNTIQIGLGLRAF